MKTTPHPGHRILGFTLIELVLVLVIIGISSAVTLPSVMRSMQGHQRRSAVRAVVASGRYARSMAVLQQTPMALVFDIDGNRIRIDPRPLRHSEQAPGDDRPPPDLTPVETPPRAGARHGSGPLIERSLERIRLAEVEIDGVATVFSKTAEVIYGINGRCTPYRVRLTDDRGPDVLVAVDALAGIEVAHEPR